MRKFLLALCCAVAGIAGMLVTDLRGEECPPCKPGEAVTEELPPPPPPGKKWRMVRETFWRHQNKYDNATDFHFKLWQKEDNIDVKGWRVCISGFNNATSQRGNQPEPAHKRLDNLPRLPKTSDSDNGQHAVDVAATGNVPHCTWVKISACFWMTDWNTKRLSNENWTKGTKDEARAGPAHGWTVDWPLDLGGNQYRHRVTITNDDATDPFILKEVKFYPTMDFIDDLEAISFPIVLPDEVTLSPGESWTYDLVTTGSFVDGHIYGTFITQSVVDTSDVLVDYFDHPPNEPPPSTIPTLTQWGIIIFCVLLFGWMAWVILRKRRRVTIGV
jgi:hypothetical protein